MSADTPLLSPTKRTRLGTRVASQLDCFVSSDEVTTIRSIELFSPSNVVDNTTMVTPPMTTEATKVNTADMTKSMTVANLLFLYYKRKLWDPIEWIEFKEANKQGKARMKFVLKYAIKEVTQEEDAKLKEIPATTEGGRSAPHLVILTEDIQRRFMKALVGSSIANCKQTLCAVEHRINDAKNAVPKGQMKLTAASFNPVVVNEFADGGGDTSV
jgi:hypothetical protein